MRMCGHTHAHKDTHKFIKKEKNRIKFINIFRNCNVTEKNTDTYTYINVKNLCRLICVIMGINDSTQGSKFEWILMYVC